MLNTVLLTYAIRGWSLSVTCNGNGKLNQRTLDLKLTQSGDRLGLVLSNHELLRRLPTSLDLFSGEPFTEAGAGRGCGYFSYFQGTDISPASVAGWAGIPNSDFDQLWALLSHPCGLAATITLCVGPLPYAVPDDHEWNVDNHRNLLISKVTCSLKSAEWDDEEI